MRAVGYETLGAGSLNLICRGTFKLVVVPLEQWLVWCEQQSGKLRAEITIEQLISAFKGGKFTAAVADASSSSASNAAVSFEFVHAVTAEPGSLVWVPPGHLVAQKLQNSHKEPQGFILRSLAYPLDNSNEPHPQESNPGIRFVLLHCCSYEIFSSHDKDIRIARVSGYDRVTQFSHKASLLQSDAKIA